MTLDAPKLDTRTFDQLMDEARARIPRFTPEWTNFNASDPGMALVQLHAWMTETILYSLNRVPDLNYVKFLDLIGIAPRPARPARTELSFTLEKLAAPDEALAVPVPLATRASVDDPDLKQEIAFETDRSLIAVNADFGMVVVPRAQDGRTRALVTEYDQGPRWLHFFDPFDAPAALNKCLYIGLVLRPKLSKPVAQYVADALPAVPLDLYADLVETGDAEPGGLPVADRPTHGCDSAGAAGPRIDWQIYTGAPEPAQWDDGQDAGWQALAVSSDGTGGLARSGHLVLELPARAMAVNPRDLPAAFWDSFGLTKPPSRYDELEAALNAMADVTALDGHWQGMGLTDDTLLSAIAACGSSVSQVMTKLNALPAAERPDPSALSAADWAEIDPVFGAAMLPMAEGGFRRLYWLRAKYRAAPEAGQKGVGRLRQFRLNTVPATQGVTRLEDRLGQSDGRPGQVFALPKRPVLIDPASGLPVLSLSVAGEEDWRPVADFYGAGPDDAAYVLDPIQGRISFGDGLRGRIPVAGAAVLVLRSRVGGGAAGNVGPGSVTKLKGQVRGVKAVTNPRAAAGGEDAETLDAVRLRAPHDLRHRDRAVSADDFADLALATPGTALHKVVALPRRALDGAGQIVARDGSVVLVLLPRSDAARPAPSQAQMRAVCRWMEPRRLVTTELHLTGPTYVEIVSVSLSLLVADGHDLTVTADAVQAAILAFLHPVGGGPDGSGWPFGAAISHADLYERILAVPGVRRAWALKVATAADPDGNALTDLTPLPEGALPSLTRDRIALAVNYG